MPDYNSGYTGAQIDEAVRRSYKSSSGVPDSATIGQIGQLYANTANGDLYECTAASGGVYTWEMVGKASIGETATTAYRGDRGKAAYDHSQAAHQPITQNMTSETALEDADVLPGYDVSAGAARKFALSAFKTFLRGYFNTLYASVVHSHAMNAITGLADALAGKAASVHSHDDRYYTEEETDTKLNAKLNTSQKGTANGLAELDGSGKVPEAQLPSYVDDVLEYANRTAFPTTGEPGKIYVAVETNLTYRWSGSTYVMISSALALGDTASTAYRGDRGKAAYDHSQTAHAPSDANNYVHPTYSAMSSALVKVGRDALGHMIPGAAVAKADITALGIPAQDTVYAHPASQVAPGAYRQVTVNAQGHVTAGSNATLTVAQGGTGATTAAEARANLGAAELDGSGKVPVGQLPALLSLGETSSAAYRGDRGKTAYDHSQTAHAPSNAERNVITTIKRNGAALNPDVNRSLDIVVPTNVSDLINDSGYLSVHQDISGKVDKVTGKGLSQNDLTPALKGNYDSAYTHSQAPHAPTTQATPAAPGIMSAADKAKLDGVAAGATRNGVLDFAATIGTTWAGASAPYTQDVAVSGLLDTDAPIVDMVASAAYATAEKEIDAWAVVYRIATAAGKITVWASDKTTQAVSVRLRVVR